MRKTNKGFALALVSLMTLAMLPSPAFAQANVQDQYGQVCDGDSQRCYEDPTPAVPCPPGSELCISEAGDDAGSQVNSVVPGGIFDISGALTAPITQGSAELEENLAAETDTSGVALAAAGEQTPVPTGEQTPVPTDDSTGEAPIYVTESESSGSSGGSSGGSTNGSTSGSTGDSGEITVLPNTGGASYVALLLGVTLVVGGFVTRRYRRASRGGF